MSLAVTHSGGSHHGGSVHFEQPTLIEPGNTGIGNGMVGMIFFLTTEAALFGALIFGYLYIRVSNTVWPPHGLEHFPVPLATWNTFILVSSGFVMHQAQSRIRKGDVKNMIRLTAVTIFMGFLFLGGQGYEYIHLWNDGVTFSGHAYGATFFTLTGLHGMHVTAGGIFLLIVLIRAKLGHFDEKKHFAVEAATLYWHFVDVVWVVLYVLFYLIIG